MEHHVGWRWVKSPWEFSYSSTLVPNPPYCSPISGPHTGHHSHLCTSELLKLLFGALYTLQKHFLISPLSTHSLPHSQPLASHNLKKKKKVFLQPPILPASTSGLVLCSYGSVLFPHCSILWPEVPFSAWSGGRQREANRSTWPASDMKPRCHIWFANQFSF